MTSDLLFLAQRIPFPPNKGDKIRSFHWLKHLSRRHRVHLGAFVDDPEDWRYEEDLRPYCASLFLEGLEGLPAKLRGVSSLALGGAITPAYYRKSSMQRWVDDRLQQIKPKMGFVYSSAMAQYLVASRSQPALPFIMDFVDVDSDKWRQYAEQKSFPMNWVYRQEAKRLLAYDRQVAKLAQKSLFVTDADADLFRELAPESAARIFTLENGIDLDFFDPESALENPLTGEGPHLVFTGAMDYWPNIDAVTWFAKEIFPLVKQTHPKAVFWIVGTRPDPCVTALAKPGAIEVTGRVEEIRGYIRYADLAVAPMRLARGIQNKVIEAMAMRRPVVTTPAGLEGIGAKPEEHLLVADSPKALAEQISRALDPERAAGLAEAARRFMVESFSWQRRFQRLDELMTEEQAMGRKSQ